ncbi:hypothetical protein [Sphingomonas quercus]|uniref:Glycine zipper family protein n=1 Tax=Sphingomonas quercus TaxID=2842451 RepID=A0ABS6BIJ3_9SPHN|nr:hypothetical protein [Sphingomonas quercus]MBU3077422.1 hypothetical protein [Sphingomonas quercus]
MASPDESPSRAGGAILALSVIAGAVIGVAMQQPTLGTLAGLVIGIAIAVAIWLHDRSRRE